MNKKEFIESVAATSGLTEKDSTVAVNAFQQVITKAMQEGDAVTLIGFGSFSVKERSARKGHNPRTGEVIDVAARKVVKFTPGSVLTTAVNTAKKAAKTTKKK